jgi:HlyD family secretion protein
MIKNIALGALALAGCSRDSPPSSGDYQGILELDERVVAFEVAGRVDGVDVSRGDIVKAGARIAKLDDTLDKLTRDVRADELATAIADLELVAAGAKSQDVASVAAEVRAAATSGDLAAKTLERAKTLHSTGAVSQSESTAHRRTSTVRSPSGARSKSDYRASARAHGHRSSPVRKRESRRHVRCSRSKTRSSNATRS